MAVLYTPHEIQTALMQLRIKPMDGKVNTEEAARILTWRAKEEQDVVHRYDGSTIRRRAMHGDITAHPVNIRFNLYLVEDIFSLPMVPRRGLAQIGKVRERRHHYD